MPSLRTQKQIMAALVVLLCLVFAPAFLYSVQGANGSSPVSPAANASDAPLARRVGGIAPLPLPPLPPRPPVRLSVSGAEKPVELRALQIESDISGRLAQTTVEMTFYNPNARVLEGELQFPLQDGQTITAFALSMNDGTQAETMREAVPVDKNKGRQVFEDVIRQNIDPALLEVTQGNNFKLRVYPLNPGQTRRVRLTYRESLPSTLHRGKAALVYRLPLAYAERVEKFRLSVRAEGVLAAPEIDHAPAGVSLGFKQGRRVNSAYLARVDAQNLRLDAQALTLRLTPNQTQAYVGERDGKRYFYAEITPSALAPATRPAPKTLSILWDASLSGQKRDHAHEFAFLDAFFAKTRALRVTLQTVRDVADAPQSFTIQAGDWRALKKALEGIVYDGATNLGAFDLRQKTDLHFLFSDGLDNYSLTPLAPPAAPLYAFVAAPGAETARLRRLAAGGAVIDLTTQDAPSAVQRVLQKAPPRIVAVEGDGIAEVFWTPTAQGDAFLVTGILTDPARPVRVIFAGDALMPREFRNLPNAANGLANAIPFLWAALKIEALEAEYDLNRGEIRRLGKAFGMATRETSLIVLDRVEDYVRYDIAPPPELKAEYDRLRAQTPPRRGEQNRLERILAEWQQREAWWQKEFPKDTPNAKKPAESSGMMLSRSPGAGLARQQPAPASVASAAAPSADMLQADATITLRPWTPDAPYLRRMKDARDADLYRVYLDERPDFANSVAFYLDVAEQLQQRGHPALALRVLSNLAEINLENRQILRVLGTRLLAAGKAKEAELIFRRVLALAEDEPQSYRDLGLAHAAAGNPQAAIDRLYDVIERDFPRQFPGLEVIALTELNAILAHARIEAKTALNPRRIDPRFLQNRPLDLRVVLTWDADNTDIDLHVIDPNGEEAFYSHPLSYQGGRVSPDNTTGYGPEEFSLKIAKPGKYRVEVKFYGHRQQMISEATTLQLDFFTRYATEKVEKQSVTLRLKEAKDRILVGEFEVK